MTEPVFPDMPGLGWSTHKSPRFATIVQKGMSGRTLRLRTQQYPIWTFTLTFPFLRDQWDSRGQFLAAGYNELRGLMDLFLRVQGGAGTFLYRDPTDNYVVAHPLYGGDGTRTVFPLFRQLVVGTGFQERVFAPAVVANVGINSVDLGGWTLNSDTGEIVFAVAPANGTAISWTGTYYFRCRFVDDSMDFENFMAGLWALQEMKFESVLP